MTKTYKAIGSIVTEVIFAKGASWTIQFTPVSNYYAGKGGSEFTTDDKDFQEALEKCWDFGRIYWLVNKNGELVTEIDEQKTSEVEEPSEPKKNLEVVKVASLADAKAWLIDHKDWQPKSRVTKKILVDVAADYGISFDGLE